MSNIKREELDTPIKFWEAMFGNSVRATADHAVCDYKRFTELLDQYTQGKVDEARQIAKKENARDFSAVVIAFNEALVAVFDAPSVLRLRTVLNGADARANYIDLPAQLADIKEKK